MTATLRGGAEVEIRPLEPDDRERLRTGFSRLSETTRYRRFQTFTPSLSEEQLRYLSGVDHHDHEALAAVDPDSGDIVAVARFVRVDGDLAECSIVVADDWQGQGLGSMLMDRLADRAREEGVRRFTALVLADNDEAIRLLQRLGETARRSAGPQVELDIELPERPGAGEPLRSLLRGAAKGAIVPAISVWRLVSDFGYRRSGPPAQQANVIVAHPRKVDAEDPAVRAAAALAALRGSHVHLVEHVSPSERSSTERTARRERAARELTDRHIPVTVHVRGGDPVDAVIDVAEETAAALIVIDPSEDTPIPSRLYSLISRVCARAPCNVLVAR